MMRIMAIDLGDVRTGLAVSDPTGTLVGEAWTITTKDSGELLKQIADAATARGVGRLVLGYPKNMDGTSGARAEKSEAFKLQLEQKTGLDVILWDERRTTKDADNILKTVGKRGAKKKKLIDCVAASLILEAYLAALRNQRD